MTTVQLALASAADKTLGKSMVSPVAPGRAHCSTAGSSAWKAGPLSGAYYYGLRVLLKTVGLFSKGVRTGLKYGFDSGESLDYVYEDQANGNAIARALDRFYLDAIGWRAIKQRRINLRTALIGCVSAVYGQGKEPKLVDIASGPGRYVLETVAMLKHIPVSAQLRDIVADGLAEGRLLAERMNVANVQYVRGDALDESGLSQLNPQPDIAIAAGVYELFSDNNLIAGSLRGIHRSLADGGYLIYTNQPAHPQLELIAQVLTKRDGAPWVMRCRSQAEMDELVGRAGFRKLYMLPDSLGITTVSVACKERKD